MSNLYVKIIGNNYGNYPYRIGLNTLKYNDEVFKSDKTSGPGGLYYTTPQYILHYVAYGDKVCILTIPTDAQIVTFDDKCKSDRIVIEKIMPLWEMETIRYLASLGANILNDYAFCRASGHGHLDIVQYLVYLGANIHAYNEHALQLAAREGHLEIVQYLVSLGANIHANNNAALQSAAKEGHLEVVLYLVSLGADILNDNYALRWSSKHGILNVVQYLLSSH